MSCNVTTKNLQNIEGKLPDQPEKKCVAPPHRRTASVEQTSMEQLIFKDACICEMLCTKLQSALGNN